MKLATIRTGESTTIAVRIDGDVATEVGASDVGELLKRPDWREYAAAATGATLAVSDLDFATLVPRPNKIICVGVNYRSHILEMAHIGATIPDFPTLFTKFTSALIGAYDDILLPPESSEMDWEVELGIVIGARMRRVDQGAALAGVAGYTVVNDISARDWQLRTTQWLAGKSFEGTTPVGPYLVTSDEAGGPSGHEVTCEVDGELMQRGNTDDLIFGAAELVAYCSTIFTLEPGDLIVSGTPSGVGSGRTPPRYLHDGSVVVTGISGIGELRNVCRTDA